MNRHNKPYDADDWKGFVILFLIVIALIGYILWSTYRDCFRTLTPEEKRQQQIMEERSKKEWEAFGQRLLDSMEPAEDEYVPPGYYTNPGRPDKWWK